MGKFDRIKQRFRSQRSTKPASTTSGTALEPRLDQTADRASGASLTHNRSQDAPVRDLWDLAFETLSSETKKTISPIMSPIKAEPRLEILRHLRNAAVEKQTECEDQRWKFDFNGRQLNLRDVAEKIIVWIDKFKEIGDIAVNFDPVHASLPWAGIRFLLEVRLMITLEENCRIKTERINR